jgi:hypothetical protein
MVVGGGQNDNNTKKNTIKLHLQNRGREEKQYNAVNIEG